MPTQLSPFALRRAYISALLITALIAVLSYGILIHSNTIELSTFEVVELSLDQGVDMQSIAFLATDLVAVNSDTERQILRQELNQKIADMASKYKQLLSVSNSDATRTIYDKSPYNLTQQTILFLEAAQKLVASKVISLDDPSYQTVIALRPALLTATRALADQYDLESLDAAAITERSQLLLLILILITLSLEVFFIFRPAEVTIRRQQAKLFDEITERQRVESSLRRSESLYRLFAENMPNSSVVMFDRDMRCTLTKGPHLRRFGESWNDAVGKLPQELLSGEPLNILLSMNNRALQGESFTFERINAEFAYQAHITPLSDSSGQIVGGMVLMHDITELKRTEDALRASEIRFHTIVDFAPVGIVETDAEGKIVFGNAYWSQLSGLSSEDHYANNASSTIHPDDLARVQATNQSMVENTNLADNIEYRFIHPDGKVVWVSDRSRPLLDPQDKITGYIVTLTDITERKHLENVLRSNEESLRLITDNVHDLITRADADNYITFASPSYRTLMGYDPQTLLGTPAQNLICPDDRERYICFRQAALKSGETKFAIEGQLLHASGHYIWVESVGRFLYDDQKNYLGWVHVTRDISERKLLQALEIESQKLQTALEKELELSDLKSRMMERIAHEFRTPLTIIQLSSETLTTYFDRLSIEQRANKHHTIKFNIQRITDMLDDIGLIVTGALEPTAVHRSSVNLTSLCQEVVEKLEEPFNKQSRFIMDVPENIIIEADPYLLKNTLLGILRNAVQFSMPSTSIQISLSQDKEGVNLYVKDAGIGMLPHEQARVFEAFFRGSNIGEISGLGLGLTIAHKAAEAHAGKLTLESVVGQGTTVHIWLPNA